MIIQHNMAAVNTMMQLGITNANLRKSSEKLSSGQKINRAADNAATLSISEKKRSQIRGLIRAARNADDGVSFVQTGDGAMSQMEALLQRMRELSIQSLNTGVNEEEDRMALQMEMDQLQCEIDRINDETEFNKKPVFEHYPDTYSIFYGNRVWSQNQVHSITPDNQSLVVKYVKEEGGEEQEITLTVPEGEYTTQELIDEMDDVVTALGEEAEGMYLEYSSEHMCNVVLREGTEIRDVSGGLSYLLFRQSGGSKVGSLIGTTLLKPNYPLQIKTGENDELSFTVEYFDGTSVPVSITVPQGSYMRSDIIRFLNDELAAKAPGITANEYSDYCIQVGGEDGFVTGLKGNMFRIDDKNKGEEVWVSVFYDNTKYGQVQHMEGEFIGAAIINPYDLNNRTFIIPDGNNTLSVRVNGTAGDPYEEITLDPGSYSVAEMVQHLQRKFDEKGIPVMVESYQSRQPSVNQPNINYTFEGIRIKTLSVGKGNKIEFDVPNSSAYSRLFENKLYTDLGRDSVVRQTGYYYYTPPSLTGGKTFTADSFPLTLDDTNSRFKITLKDGDGSGDEYTISMTEKEYNSLNDIIEEINKQIKAGGIGLQKIQAGEDEGKIKLTPVSGSNSITEIGVVPVEGSDGYDTLFVGSSTTYNKRSPAIFDIKPNADGKIVFDDKNNKMTVELSSTDQREVTIPAGEYDSVSLAEKITEQLERETTYDQIKYQYSTTTGKSGQVTPSGGANGSADPKGTTSEEGTGGISNGSTEIKDGKPAKCWVNTKMPDSVDITSDNSEFKIQIDNNTVYKVSLVEKIGQTMSKSDLISFLQEKLDQEIESDANKVKVSLNKTGQFQIEAKYPGQKKITMPASGFLTSIDKDPKPATVTTTALAEQIVFDGEQTLNIRVNGVVKEVKFGPGSYTRQQILDKLNGVPGVSARLDGYNQLVLQTDATGNTADLWVIPSGSAYTTLLNTPATITTQSIPDYRTVIRNEDQRPGIFDVTVNGTLYTVTIPDSPEEGYTRQEIANELDRQLKDMGVRVDLDGNGRLKFRTDATGDGVSLKVNGTLGATADTPPEIKAEAQPDGTIHLIPKDNRNYAVTPGGRDSLLQPTGGITSTSGPEEVPGSVNGRNFQMVTENPFVIPNPVRISNYAQSLKFKYRIPSGNATKDVTIQLEMDEGSYTHDQLKDALQAKLDAAMGAAGVPVDEGVNVDITPEGKMTLTAKKQGNYYIYPNSYSSGSMTGGFYEYVMKGSILIGSKEDPVAIDGRQVTDDIYIVGRKDIRNGSSVIEKGLNDDLSIDVTVNGTVHTLKTTLDPGEYKADALIKMLQGKLDEALEAAQIPNLPVGAVKAGIGVYDPKVEGSDDSNSLFFYLNPDTDLDAGQYRIDGLGGKSLFTIFYKTEGDLMPAYLSGTKDISGGVEIIPGVNDSFTIDVDGVSFPYTIVPSGEYTTEELIELLNEKILKSPNAHLKAKMSGNSLKLEYEKMGEHTIANIQGPAKMTLFYQVDGRVGGDTGLWLQIGANAGQGMTLERFSMSTLSMGINSIVITQKKYADKALQRLDNALNYLNSSRSVYGAKQNRLEYAIKGNNNTAENVQASESRDRDADMADEMVQFAKSQIMEQAGTALLAQMFQQPQNVLALLR